MTSSPKKTTLTISARDLLRHTATKWSLFSTKKDGAKHLRVNLKKEKSFFSSLFCVAQHKKPSLLPKSRRQTITLHCAPKFISGFSVFLSRQMHLSPTEHEQSRSARFSDTTNRTGQVKYTRYCPLRKSCSSWCCNNNNCDCTFCRTNISFRHSFVSKINKKCLLHNLYSLGRLFHNRPDIRDTFHGKLCYRKSLQSRNCRF